MKIPSGKKLFLVDTFAFVFRSYYAIPASMSNDKGLTTNALYGFTSMVIKLLREYNPDYISFCFDRSDGSFRNELYAEYKANRGEMPEDLSPQIPYVRKILDAFGLNSIDVKGFEADDVIGTMCALGQDNAIDTYIISSDKDFAQCVSPRVSLFDPMRENLYDEQGVVDKWGVHPYQMIDYLAIVGDASDNVPGIKGIGPKGAQKLLAEYKHLEGIYENIDKISAKGTKLKLEQSEDVAYLSKELVTIATSVETNLKLDDLKLKPVERENLVGLFNELGFKSFEKKFFKDKDKPSDEDEGKETKKKVRKKSTKTLEEVTLTVEQADEYIKPYAEVWAIDTARGLYLQTDKKIILIDGELPELGQRLLGKHISWKGFDLKSSWRKLEMKDVSVPAWDHMLAAYTLKPGNIKTFESIYEQYLGEKLSELPTATDYYNAHLELESELQAQLKEKIGDGVYQELELPLVPVLFTMEKNGIFLDTDQLAMQSKTLEKDITRLEKDIHKEADEAFNVASPKQLGQILFEKMNIPVVKKNKTGYSTSADVLLKLAPEYPIANMVIEYRELAKLKNTYVDSLPELVNNETHRVHTQFKQAVTSTGRLSSANPNLQNIPIRTERGRLVRKAFSAPPGKVLLSLDYSQIELRVLAHITDDPGLCSAFKEGRDIHSATASEVFSVELSEVSTEMRRKAKAVNFGIAYGQGAFGLADTLGISRAEAKEIIATYFTKFKNVKTYMEETIEKAKEDGYVTTIMGRKRYIKELAAKNPMLRKFGERAAINAPIQGSASDIVKLAMIKVFAEITAPLILQVHDELIFECDKDDVEEQMQEIKKIMEETTRLKVPLVVNGAFGSNWDEAH